MDEEVKFWATLQNKAKEISIQKKMFAIWMKITVANSANRYRKLINPRWQQIDKILRTLNE